MYKMIMTIIPSFFPTKYLPLVQEAKSPWRIDTDVPHTQLGNSGPKRGGNPQAREWVKDEHGRLVPKRDIDFTDHGTPEIHPNPHQHRLEPNNPSTAPKGGYQRGNPEPLEFPTKPTGES